MRILVAAVLASLAASCSTLEFYRQAAAGELSILRHRQSSAELIEASDTDPHLRDRLLKVAQLLQFAGEHLGLQQPQFICQRAPLRHGCHDPGQRGIKGQTCLPDGAHAASVS